MISKSPKKSQGVSMMYGLTNIQAQWMLQCNVKRVSCGKDRMRWRRWGEKLFLVTISCYYVLFDGVYPVGST